MRKARFVVVVAVLLVSAAVGAWAADEKLIAGRGAKDITVSDVKYADGSVSGALKNNTSRELRDVRLMVHHTWFWKNEMSPGDDSPGRVEYYTVPESIDPRGEITFRYQPKPPLPTDRTDGHFETKIDVVGYTEIGD